MTQTKQSNRYLPQLPKLPDADSDFYTCASRCREDERDLEQVRFSGEYMEEEDFGGLNFDTVLFENCTLIRCRFKGADFKNVLFKNCQLPGCSFAGSWLDRTHFDNCQLVGTDFSQCKISHTSFTDCAMTMANFTESKLEECSIASCDLTESFFANCKFKKLQMDKNQCIGTEFFKTKLKDVDFTTCILEGIRVSTENGELKGAKVNLFQAAELARMLGIVIKE
ncbi:pentapeptide repeat-containing protein [Ihubacter sp. mB4P-1]|uniref:pentapeptide repeat-containing protein n=1 Tax=Ihubacter sp. mB4P-1 TaxID=3242370 RepID=UPI003C79B7A9